MMPHRTTVVLLLAVFAGCSISSYKEKFASHLPREDGSMLNVQCVSHVKHSVSTVSAELSPEPQVKVVMDERTFVVYADRILLNGQPYGTLASDAKEVLIEITEGGFEVTADGKPIAR